jgi:hypothetical protein
MLFFLSKICTFYFLSSCCCCFISLARTSNTLLTTSGKSRHPCLLLDLREKIFSLSPLSLLAIGFYRCSLLSWVSFPLFLYFSRFFYHEWMSLYFKPVHAKQNPSVGYIQHSCQQLTTPTMSLPKSWFLPQPFQRKTE